MAEQMVIEDPGGKKSKLGSPTNLITPSSSGNVFQILYILPNYLNFVVISIVFESIVFYG